MTFVRDLNHDVVIKILTTQRHYIPWRSCSIWFRQSLPPEFRFDHDPLTPTQVATNTRQMYKNIIWITIIRLIRLLSWGIASMQTGLVLTCCVPKLVYFSGQFIRNNIKRFNLRRLPVFTTHHVRIPEIIAYTRILTP